MGVRKGCFLLLIEIKEWCKRKEIQPNMDKKIISNKMEVLSLLFYPTETIAPLDHKCVKTML